MCDALWTDVHPAAGGHLTVVGNTQSSSAVEGFLVIEHTNHQTVGDDNTRGGLVGFKQTQRVTGFNDQRLVIGEHLEIFFDQTVLHPVLADLTGFTVGGQLVRIQGNVKVQVVVDHDLESLAFDAVAFVLVDWFAVQLSCRAEAVAIDSAVLLQLLCKFLCHLLMMVRMDVAQCVFDCQRFVGFAQMGFSSGSAADAFFKGRIFWKLIIKFDHHGFFRFIGHKENLLNIFY